MVENNERIKIRETDTVDYPQSISKGMTVLDLGCGPGYFTTELAKMVGERGRVIAADLQVHEVPDQTKLFRELKSVLKQDGNIYIIEPKFHVSAKSFETMLTRIENIGFEIKERPKVAFSRAVLLKIRFS